MLLGLRPEHLVLNDAAPWCSVVSVVGPTGAKTHVVVNIDPGNVTVRNLPQLAVQPGERVG